MPLYGPVWPLKRGNRDTYEVYDNLTAQISFYLKNLLLTSPGENISDPRYGVGLRRYLFEQNAGAAISSLRGVIRNQIARYLPEIRLKDVQVKSSPADIDSNTVLVKIVYYIGRQTDEQVFVLDLYNTEEIGIY